MADASIHLGSVAWLGHPILVLCPGRTSQLRLEAFIATWETLLTPPSAAFQKHFIILVAYQ